MGTVHLAFLWHLHQPCYKDLLSGKILMPWVRMHGIKDYTGMALLLEAFPHLRCTVNFSAGLLAQIQDYTRGATDVDLELARRPATDLSESEKHLILKRFFSAHPETMIGVYPRYAELKEKSAGEPASFTPQDFLDLQVLANLAWFHPLVAGLQTELQRLKDRGRNFTEDDKEMVLTAQARLLEKIIPRWKTLQDRGQVDISVSPFYHPILPLLLDMKSARPGLPDCPLPESSSLLAKDAASQVERAVTLGRVVFGKSPMGMWPSEGAVSAEALILAASNGIRWMATDEAILSRSLGRPIARDGEGVVQEPGVLYTPYDVGGTAVVFRDHELSDLIGFVYKTWDPADASVDFVNRLKRIAKRVPGDALVTVICDGENPWEHYHGNGVPFLTRLYQELSNTESVRTVTIGEYLETHPSMNRLETIHPGSWIDANFAIWIGHEEDRRGWELLIQARKDWEAARASGTIPEDRLILALECLYAAEGSDWFWWFGPEFATSLDQEFDALFRGHLINACLALGQTPPESLRHPIKAVRREISYEKPWAALHVKIDGQRSDYFEWIGAGHYEVTSEAPTMVSELSPITDVYFGFDERSLLLRFDIKSGADYNERVRASTITLRCVQPREQHAVVWGPGKPERILGEVGRIVEASCPFDALGYREGEEVKFFIDVEESQRAKVSIPADQPLSVMVPSADVTKIYWQA